MLTSNQYRILLCLRENRINNNENQEDSGSDLFDWIPDLGGPGDKTGAVDSGSTLVSEDATEINHSGIEGKEVEGEIEIDVLQYVLRGAPGSLDPKSTGLIDAISSGADLINEILNDNEPEYDFPLPEKEKQDAIPTENDKSLDTEQGKDSIEVKVDEKTRTTMWIMGRKRVIHGSAIKEYTVLPKDTIGGILFGDPNKPILK